MANSPQNATVKPKSWESTVKKQSAGLPLSFLSKWPRNYAG
jgi:hypothetical protein